MYKHVDDDKTVYIRIFMIWVWTGEGICVAKGNMNWRFRCYRRL